MKKYPLLISFALLYWGFNTENLIVAIIFMILLESHRIVKFRWNFTNNDFNMISVLSTLASIGYLVYYINSNREIGPFSSFLQFFPIILFPLIFFYLYSTSEFINAKRLFLLFVINKYSIVHPYTKKFQPDNIFFASLILGGSISPGIYSFPMVILLILPILIFHRSRNYRLFTWVVSTLSVILIALVLQFSISNTFFFLKDVMTDLYIAYFLKYSDKSVSIGNIGSMKDDFRIELRAEVYGRIKPYYYLKDNVFNNYSNGKWQTISDKTNKFSQSYFEYDSTAVDSVRIFFFSAGRKTYLKLPLGTGTISGISENKMQINTLGKISVKDPQHLIDYKTYIRKDSTINLFSEPDDNDLKINTSDNELISPIIDSLGLEDMTLKEVNYALSNFFTKKYRYSLGYIDQQNKNKLKNFINEKEGHCELFATLSCLIFRQLGYPSRYITGYLLSEYNEFEELHVARKKDRHAWIYVNDNDGNWYEFDTTPPDISLNRSDNGLFGNIYDLFSYTYYKIFLLKSQNNDLFKNLLLLSIIPFALFLLYRILRNVKHSGKEKKDSKKYPYILLDDLSLIQEKLKNNKIEDHETLLKWFDRIRRERRNAFLTEAENEKFDIIQKLYYQKRYFSEDFNKELDKELKKQIDDIP
ncbi:MAG: transglutaminase domain-containing protein [Candidatus Delongbacteria bacterium]|nr:transglutaminase domain-containing protein [Candidatus Delongbacteria bacterium]